MARNLWVGGAGRMSRLLRIGVAGLLPALACTALAGGAEDYVVYRDGLHAGWQNWSWNTTVNFANAAPAYGGTGASVSVRYTAAWAGLYLHSSTTLLASDYERLRFQVHGGTGGGQQFRVTAYDAGLAAGTAVNVAPPAAGAWAVVDVPVGAFGVTTISGLTLQDSSGGAQDTFYVDEVVLIAGATQPGAGPALSVNPAADRRPISPHIYGLNFADPGFAAEIGLPVNRWGGNATTRYSYIHDTSNRASDWFFENIPNDNPNPGQLPTGSASDDFVEENIATGADTIMTLPLIGWTPRARGYAGGFAVSRYGPQQAVDPYRPDFGNGVRPDGTRITGNDPLDTSVAIGPAFVQGWIAHLIGRFGAASAGGVRFYNLDNEPMLWNETHRDVHPAPTSYDEMRDRTFAYGAAIKAADTGALTLGPVEWGWTGYFYSAADWAAGGAWWNTRPDRMAHGDVPFVEWYLQQLRAYQQTNGVRILDYLDLHYYPQAAGVSLSPAGDAATQQRRLRSTRSLWDATYTDESWIAEAVRLIPRMRDWVNQHYPGTKLAITEYNWGGLEHINGALAQADVLGIFGREGLDLATMWAPPGPQQPGAFAFRIYRNFDGDGGRFGETSVRAVSADLGRASIYAAERPSGALTVVVINKTAGAMDCPLEVSGVSAEASARVYRYSSADVTQILRDSDLALAGGAATLHLPASSITLLEIPALRRGDANCDGGVDFFDIDPFLLALFDLAGYEAAYCGGMIGAVDVDCSGAVDFFDIDPFLACVFGTCAPCP